METDCCAEAITIQFNHKNVVVALKMVGFIHSEFVLIDSESLKSVGLVGLVRHSEHPVPKDRRFGRLHEDSRFHLKTQFSP